MEPLSVRITANKAAYQASMRILAAETREAGREAARMARRRRRQRLQCFTLAFAVVALLGVSVGVLL